jgi:membrane-bound lytic murein transglycosylase B
VVLLVVALVAIPAGHVRAQPTPEDLEAVAYELAVADQSVADTQSHLQGTLVELDRVQVRRDLIAARLGADQAREARLIADARSYALARYVHHQPGEGVVRVLALFDEDRSDAAWALATFSVTSSHAAERALEVRDRRIQVDAALLDAEIAVSDQAAVVAQAQLLRDQAQEARETVLARFEQAVAELGMSTINGMTTVAYQAYTQSVAVLAAERPSCGLRWELLAAIGKTESNHGAGRLDAAGNSTSPIVGIPIGRDSDGGVLDLDPQRDHAVGPMQFIPTTWARWGTDANGDGLADPHNIFDAAVAAGRYLCAAASDLTLNTKDGVVRAILAYNPSETYLRVVGARYEALAADLDGWFSSGDLPHPSPAPVDPNAPGTARPTDPPPPAPTKVLTFEPFVPLSTTTTLPGSPDPFPLATCDGASDQVGGRAGYLRCTLAPPEVPVDPGTSTTTTTTTAPPTTTEPPVVYEPCQVNPADPTLVACGLDPAAPVVYLRLVSPAPDVVPAPPPPYRLLVLEGGDRCLPTASPAPLIPPVTATTTIPTTVPSTTTPTTTGSTGRSPTTTPPPTTPPAASTTVAGTSAAPSSTGSTGSTEPGGSGSGSGSLGFGRTFRTTTTTPAPAPAPTTPAPGPPPLPYRCSSGAEVIAQPDTAAPAWVVSVRQAGVPDRTLLVVEAYV